jgi:hypothetical protein
MSKLKELILDPTAGVIELLIEADLVERDRDNWQRVALNLGAIDSDYDKAVKDINNEQNKTNGHTDPK